MLNGYVNHKFSSRHNNKTGFNINQTGFDIISRQADPVTYIMNNYADKQGKSYLAQFLTSHEPLAAIGRQTLNRCTSRSHAFRTVRCLGVLRIALAFASESPGASAGALFYAGFSANASARSS